MCNEIKAASAEPSAPKGCGRWKVVFEQGSYGKCGDPSPYPIDNGAPALCLDCQPSAPVERETGERLDAIGELYGVQRDGKSDASYRSEVEARIRSIGERRPECSACEGWGSIATGIDESPSVQCSKCSGTGLKP